MRPVSHIKEPQSDKRRSNGDESRIEDVATVAVVDLMDRHENP